MYKATLIGRSLLLVVSELVFNAICWITAGILFGRHRDTQPILSLALLAWVMMFRLDLRARLISPSISAIDNATRTLVGLGQLPVTCGLFFSLGHSTIVVAVNIAIAISSNVYNKIHGVGTVGAIVGAAVSGSFLFIVGLANSIILWRIIKKRRQNKIARARRPAEGAETGDFDDNHPKHNHMLMMRILGPVVKFVDRPWKMYPVGVLFGFGFDTASSIALLAVSAIATKGTDGKSIPSADIIILPFIFTAGMTLIDCCDSILMLYSYSGFPDRSWALFEKRGLDLEGASPERLRNDSTGVDGTQLEPGSPDDEKLETPPEKTVRLDKAKRDLRIKRNMMSGLSILLTVMSILVAFSISLIVIMGLIGDNCRRCKEAAEAEDGGGLAGRWWRGWANANEHSGYIGAAIVGVFIFVVSGWFGVRWVTRKVMQCV